MVRLYEKDVTYQERMLLFHNTGSGWMNVSEQAGPAFAKPVAGRGLALGDFDNDGAVDVLAAVNNDAPMLLHNRAARGNHWLGVRLAGRKANRDAIGAAVAWQAGGRKHRRVKVGGGSFLSSHDPRMVLGLGQASRIDSLEVHWPQPGGDVERFHDLPIDRYVTIVEGAGKWS